MGTYDNQPGGGYQPVKGYNPPAGSQAEKIDLANQARQSRPSEPSFPTSPSFPDSFAGPSTPRPRAGTRQNQGTSRSAPPRRGPSLLTRLFGGAEPKRPPTPARPQRPWHPLFGVIGFLATTLAVGSFLSGQNKWILAAAIGVAGGAIIGRLWKPILALAAVAGGLWIFSRTPRDAPSGATPSDPGAWSAATPPSAPIYNNTYTQPPPAPPPAAQARAPSPPPTPADPPRARRTLPPPADQFPGGAANAFLNDTEAVYNVDRIVDDDQITIRHVREIAQDELRLVTYDAHAGQAWVLYPDNTPFPLGLSIDPADRDAWSRAKLVWFLKVTPQDTRVPSDPSFALLLRQAPQ